MKNFIGTYPKAFSDEFCDRIIETMDNAFNYGLGESRTDVNDRTLKEDTQLFNADWVSGLMNMRPELINEFNQVFWSCYGEYAEEYASIKEYPKHAIHGIKLQRTKVGEGYHVWHHEVGSLGDTRRLFTFIVYLNDIEEGGETEFLYQHLRVKPEKGTVVIWPAGFTHTHRGNPPLCGTKYIMTGWIEA